MISRDIHPQDLACSSFGESLIPLLNDLAKYIQDQLIEELRTGIAWFKFLEDLRVSRIQQEGGKLVIRNKSKVEIDVHGTIHSLPEREVYVDTSILHNNLQRLEVPAALRAIEDNRLQSHGRLRGLHGDLACIIQYGFNLTVPFLQRVWRGVLGRSRSNTLRLYFFHLSTAASAITLQSWARTLACQLNYSKLLVDYRAKVYTSNIILVQKLIRGWTKWHIYQGYKQQILLDRMNEAATLFQAHVRGFLHRRKHTTLLQHLSGARHELTQEWAATTLQRVIRGYLSRRFLIRSYKIRKRLPPRLLRLTEKYLLKGDLWRFLEEIGDELRVMQLQVRQHTTVHY